MALPLELGALLACAVLWALPGRLVLAWLPPGRPGAHSVRTLPATWAASLLLSGALCASFQAAASLLSVRLAAELVWVLVSVLLVALALRIATLPGKLVPRHEPAHEPARGAAQLVALALAASAVVVLRRAYAGTDTPTLLALPTFAALLVLLGDGWATARRAPLERRLALLASLWLLARPVGDTPLWQVPGLIGCMLALGGSAALAIGWYRRADARGLASAALGLVPVGGVWLAVALPCARPAARRRVLAWTLVATLLGLPILYGRLRGALVWAASLDGTPFGTPGGTPVGLPVCAGFAAWGWLPLVWFTSAAAALAGVRGGRRHPSFDAARPQAIEEPRAELFATLALVPAFALGAVLALGARAPDIALVARALEPVALLAAGLVFLRAERPGLASRSG